ncbi:cysteine synthase family protein [Candidatus Babeliales bacterium]|nr:cysteine synthase family protein [Candidatus Babeliales bacterium]
MENFKDLLGLIGNTPIVKLNFGTKPTILAKLEYLNPGGSIKDRSALYMIEEAEKSRKLKPGGTIIEASSGNQGIALAMIGAYKGYNVIITVPDRTSTEKVSTLRAYGAEVYVCPDTDQLEDPNGYHSKAEELLHNIPGAFMPNQYYNISNPQAHYATTGREVWEQTDGNVTHFICGMGSCGTISGAGKYLKEKNKNIKVIGVDAATSKLSAQYPKKYKTEGIGVDVISDTLNMSVIDEVVPIEDNPAFEMTKDLAKKGILVGLSSGAVMEVALNKAKQLTEDDIIVVILADSGRAYLSKVFNF